MSPLQRITSRRQGVKRRTATLFLVCALLFNHAANAEVAVEQVLEDLHAPASIAIAPGNAAERYEVFVAESGGGRIVMFPSDRPGMRTVVIEGLAPGEDATTAADGWPTTRPLGLMFLDEHRLVVGFGGDDKAGIRLYELAGRETPLEADHPAQQLEFPQGEDRKRSMRAVHAFARTRANDHVPDMLIAACIREDGDSELWKIPVRAGTLGEASAFFDGDDMSRKDVAPAIAVSPQGYVVAVENAAAGDQQSRLTFYDPVKSEPVLQLPLELRSVVGLAYSPRGNLFAVEFGSGGSNAGGVYRLEDAGEPGMPACKAVKIADAPRPTALAFGRDGALYVTALGDADDDDSDNGVVLKITGEL